MKRRNEMLTLMGDEDVTVQAGKPMTVKGEAALPYSAKAGFAPKDFFFLKISSGGERAARGGASAPFTAAQHG